MCTFTNFPGGRPPLKNWGGNVPNPPPPPPRDRRPCKYVIQQRFASVLDSWLWLQFFSLVGTFDHKLLAWFCLCFILRLSMTFGGTQAETVYRETKWMVWTLFFLMKMNAVCSTNVYCRPMFVWICMRLCLDRRALTVRVRTWMCEWASARACTLKNKRIHW